MAYNQYYDLKYARMIKEIHDNLVQKLNKGLLIRSQDLSTSYDHVAGPADMVKEKIKRVKLRLNTERVKRASRSFEELNSILIHQGKINSILIL
jgi:hypothetical protein